MASLQDQLLKAGVVDKGKSQKIKKQQHKKKKAGKGSPEAEEAARLANQARAAKQQKDKEINQQKQQQAQRKAIEAQMKQLMENNKLVREGGDIPYQFSYKKSIKKLYITEPQQQQLLLGQVAIVELHGDFELVPAKVAEKIAQRDESRVVVMNSGSENSVDEDDPYKDYQIPDDLMW